MIKKVKVEQLEPGIFVHDFNCQWRESNLRMDQLLIKDKKIVDLLISMGVKEVYIDTDRGRDVSDAKPALEVKLEAEKVILTLGQNEQLPAATVSFKEELQVARHIKKQAVDVMEKAMANVRSGKPLETESTYDLIEKMNESITRNKDALLLLTRIRMKDEYTLMHSISVGAYILNFCNANQIPHDRTMNLAIGAMFHDLGKTMVPLEILNKPGKLDDSEFEMIKRHPVDSAEILRGTEGLPAEAYDMGLHHHERCDGKGYPHGLKGEEISYASQLAAVADVYDALTSDRCYKKGIDRVEGLRKLYEWSEYHFNKELTYQFIRSIGVYPIGACVKLASERVGVVIGSTDDVIKPVVRVFFDERRKVPLAVFDLDLSQSDDSVAGYEDPKKWELQRVKLFDDVQANFM